MLNLVLFGPPGAGKGTQSVKLIEKFDLVHLSTGDIFRANIKGGTALGILAKSYIDKGQLVPDEVTIGMLASEVNSNPNAKGFIFDGFPRTQAQALALDNLLNLSFCRGCGGLRLFVYSSSIINHHQSSCMMVVKKRHVLNRIKQHSQNIESVSN